MGYSGFGIRKCEIGGHPRPPGLWLAVTNPESRIPNPDDREAIISVRGLVNRFGEQVVHEGLDLDVRRGEILGVVGGSGTGKSVLMRSILGLRRPNAGSIDVLGVGARADDADSRLHIERKTGVLFQDGALFSSLTGGVHVDRQSTTSQPSHKFDP